MYVISQVWISWKLWISRQITDWINLSCNWAFTKHWPGLFFFIINLTRKRSGGGIFFKHLYEILLFIKSPIHMNLTSQPTLQPAEHMLQILERISTSPSRMKDLLERNANVNVLRGLLHSCILNGIFIPKNEGQCRKHYLLHKKYLRPKCLTVCSPNPSIDIICITRCKFFECRFFKMISYFLHFLLLFLFDSCFINNEILAIFLVLISVCSPPVYLQYIALQQSDRPLMENCTSGTFKQLSKVHTFKIGTGWESVPIKHL